jgi:hypothetical protein
MSHLFQTALSLSGRRSLAANLENAHQLPIIDKLDHTLISYSFPLVAAAKRQAEPASRHPDPCLRAFETWLPGIAHSESLSALKRAISRPYPPEWV